MALPQPGRDNHPEDSEWIGQHWGLLGLAGGAPHHRDGDLLETQLVLEGFEDDLVGVEAVLAQMQLVELRDPDGAVAVRAVGDLHASEQRDHAREKDHPEVTDAPCLLVEAHKTGAEHEVRLALHYGLHQTLELFGLVLPVGVEVDDDLGLLGLRYREARPQGVALAPVDHVGHDGHALLPGDSRRLVGRAVVHDDRFYLVTQDLIGDTAQHPPDAALLVVGGHDYQHLAGMPLGPLFGREVLLGVLPHGEAGDDLAAAAPGRPHAPEHVQKQREEQEVGETEQGEGAVLQAEHAAHRFEDLWDDRDQDDAEADQEREEQVEPAPPAPELEDAVRREEQRYDDAGDAYMFGLQHQILLGSAGALLMRCLVLPVFQFTLAISTTSPGLFCPNAPEPPPTKRDRSSRSLPMALLLVYALLLRPPQRGGGNLRDVAAVGVLSGYLGDLL